MIWLRRFVVFFVAVAVIGFVGLQIWFAQSVAPVEPFTPTADEQATLTLFSQPESWFLANLGGPREVVDGQTLDPKLQYLAEQRRKIPALFKNSLPFLFSTPWGRAFVRHAVDRDWLLMTKKTPEMARVEDKTVDGRGGPIAIRIYWPQIEAAGPLPLLIYHHGGGWIISSIVAEDRVARLIANEAKAIVISVNYRLAPEHPYPSASDDGEDVFLWARMNATSLGGDPAKVGVGGDSAGGHVAINIAQRQVKANKPTPSAMLLYYPGAGLPVDDPSYAMFGSGYDVDTAFIEFILPLVFPGYDRTKAQDDLVDPAGAKSLKGLPPTVIATAGFDILRDSGKRFAERLEGEGIPVSYTNYPSLTHSFLQLSAVVKDADEASTASARLFGDAIRASNPAALFKAKPGD